MLLHGPGRAPTGLPLAALMPPPRPARLCRDRPRPPSWDAPTFWEGRRSVVSSGSPRKFKLVSSEVYMKTYLVGAFGLLMLVSLCVGQSGNVPAGGANDDLDKKLESVRKQIEEFHKKEQALREEFLEQEKARIEEHRKQEQPLLERRKKLEQQKMELDQKKLELVRKAEEEERKHHYARMEIQGRLHRVPSAGRENANDVWRIQFGGLSANLDFGANKELLATAEQHVGQRVVITGNLTTTRNEQRHYYYYHSLESYKVTVESLCVSSSMPR
jgi:hypothetical protein